MRVWQKNMAELYLKQKDKGGIIDVEAEKNKYLLTDSDVSLQRRKKNMMVMTCSDVNFIKQL